jgi:thiamine-monophosphate kinase
LPLAERKLIERIRQRSGNASGAVIHGVGDDCAVVRLPSGQHDLLVTTDLSVEDVHFRRLWHPPHSAGHRCLARGLSDIAAMGGQPVACFLSLGLPFRLAQRWVDSFLQGVEQLARRFKIQLAGGDISSAPKITADIVVAGQVPRGKAVLRSGACPGDRIYVTGELGGSAAVLKRLFAGERIRTARSNRHFYPEPRVDVGHRLLRNGLATAMIDISDGLSVDLGHICRESGVAARIEASEVPVARTADLKLALHGGEDYELLFTAPFKARIAETIDGVRITQIGAIVTQSQKDYSSAIKILEDNGKWRTLAPRGWQHFAGKSRKNA